MIRDIDVAAAIYGKLGWMDSWKLQKLTYYVQSWSLAWTGQPMFRDVIQAWDDGPVAPELYRVNKWETAAMSTKMPGASPEHLHADAVSVVDSVLSFYGGLNKPALIDLTHGEAPWNEAYSAGRNSEITHASMMRFYTKLSVIGGAVPDRPDLAPVVVTTERLETRSSLLQQRWAGTLELLAK